MYAVDHAPHLLLSPGSGAVRLSPARRILDVAVAGVLLVVLAPLLVMLALLVGISSGGPVLFRQRRTGEGWREFSLYKFRTMRNGSGGPCVTADSDARVTPAGFLLRRLHLDELPQLWNVLCGDMTLAGPRPEIPELARRYPPEYGWVFCHRPGLTGPCQLRSRSYAVQLDGRPDAEDYYLTVLVPQRVALDADFLGRATVPNVLRMIAGTCWYLLTTVAERRPRPPESRALDEAAVSHGPGREE